MWQKIVNWWNSLFAVKATAPVVSQPVTPGLQAALSWELNHPERKEWSPSTYNLIESVWSSLKRAQDVTTFRPDFNSLNESQQKTVWCEFFSTLAKLESSWNPRASDIDVGTEDDKDTWSIGLLQMSVIDQESYKISLGYNYDDLLLPVPNLKLGILIMAKQIDKYGKIIIRKDQPGEYWSTISPGYDSEQISTIAKSVQAIKFTGAVAAPPITPKQPIPSTLALDTSQSMKTKGKMAAGGPKGMIVHFTAGRARNDQDAIDTISWGKDEGYSFWCVAPSGKIFKTHPENEWGYHAGASSWPGLGESVSQYLLGLEVACAGGVEKLGSNFKTWFGTILSPDVVRYSTKNANIQAGYYHEYTAAQEESIAQVAFHLKRMFPNTFSFDFVLGHDEVAPTRKNDPGASLSMTMPAFREYLKKRWAESNK